MALGTLAIGGLIEHGRRPRNFVREVGSTAKPGARVPGHRASLGAGASTEMGSHFQRAVAKPNAVFAALGLDTDKLTAPLKDAMLQVADSFAKVTNPTDRAKMAVNMFGRAGDEMIPVLAHLRQKMDALRNSERVGATERAQVKATDQAFSEMTRALGGLGPRGRQERQS